MFLVVRSKQDCICTSPLVEVSFFGSSVFDVAEIAWKLRAVQSCEVLGCGVVQRLSDSELGEAMVGGGLQGDLRQPVFSVGLKGVDPDNFQKVLSLPANGLLSP